MGWANIRTPVRKRLTVLVPVNDHLRLERIARAREIPVSVLARELLLAALEREEDGKRKECEPDG